MQRVHRLTPRSKLLRLESAKVKSGWHPTQITLDQLAAGIEKLHMYCNELGRSFESIPIVARPGNTYPIPPESHRRHLELGVTHLVADTPIQQEDPTLEILKGAMEQIAKICGLRGPHIAGDTSA